MRDRYRRHLLSDCPRRVRRFKSDDEILESAVSMFRVREAWKESLSGLSEVTGGVSELEESHRRWLDFWHRSFERTGHRTVLSGRCLGAKLDGVDREILVLLILGRLALWSLHSGLCREILEVVEIPGRSRLGVLRKLSEQGVLYRSNLIVHSCPDEELVDRRIIVDPSLVESALTGEAEVREAWSVETESAMYAAMSRLTTALQRRMEIIEHMECGYGLDHERLFRETRIIDRLLVGLMATLEEHPDWKLRKLLELGGHGTLNPMGYEPASLSSRQLVLLVLMGRELGHVRSDASLFTGRGLARAVCERPYESTSVLEEFGEGGYLIEEGLIRPLAGPGTVLLSTPSALGEVDFELSDRSLSLLELKKDGRRRRGRFEVREPRFGLSNLALSDECRVALEMACLQARHADVMLGKWGLGEMIPYGRSVTLLFYGPPGTGKTASAEALASELGCPILVANYAEIQNSYVGQTEKNVVRTFREASDGGALLFWDEVDSMLSDRDGARHNWEVREVNVLLQELERFEGVCVLATNRLVELDRALERRIALKVAFERPSREMRERIWSLLVPRTLPLSRSVDLGELAAEDLSGGEIKNVILNAARHALRRGRRARLTRRDFEEAIRRERDGGWTGVSRRIGFE